MYDSPLDGLRVLVTRERAASLKFAERLQGLGAAPLICPAIEIELRNPPGLDEALIELQRFDWLVLTSANAIRAIAERFEALGLDPIEFLKNVEVAVVGDATHAALVALGGRAEVVADPANAEQLAAQLETTGVGGNLILFPASRIARPDLPHRLRLAGAGVVQLAVYDTVAPAEMHVPDADQIDVATFTSPSTVLNVAARVSLEWRHQMPALCIGETTADAARGAGFSCPMIAPTASLDGITAALSDFNRQRQLEEGLVGHDGA